MSRTINRVRNNVTFSPHITNASKRGDIHLSISSSARMRVFKDNFSKIPRNLCQNDKFCQARVNSWNATASGYRYTENPTLATCRDCISKANAWEVFDNTNCVSNGKFRLSKVSIKNLVKWIPTNCEVLINNKGINVIDGLTKETIKVDSIDKAALLIAEKCFKPFTNEEFCGSEDLLSKSIYDFSSIQYEIQGVNFDKKTKKFSGLILKNCSNNQLANLTFEMLLELGYYFKGGGPCGSYLKNRKALVDTDIKENMGINVDVDNAVDLDINILELA
jgi:hypothetical protein